MASAMPILLGNDSASNGCDKNCDTLKPPSPTSPALSSCSTIESNTRVCCADSLDSGSDGSPETINASPPQDRRVWNRCVPTERVQESPQFALSTQMKLEQSSLAASAWNMASGSGAALVAVCQGFLLVLSSIIFFVVGSVAFLPGCMIYCCAMHLRQGKERRALSPAAVTRKQMTQSQQHIVMSTGIELEQSGMSSAVWDMVILCWAALVAACQGLVLVLSSMFFFVVGFVALSVGSALFFCAVQLRGGKARGNLE